MVFWVGFCEVLGGFLWCFGWVFVRFWVDFCEVLGGFSWGFGWVLELWYCFESCEGLGGFGGGLGLWLVLVVGCRLWMRFLMYF